MIIIEKKNLEKYRYAVGKINEPVNEPVNEPANRFMVLMTHPLAFKNRQKIQYATFNSRKNAVC